MFRFLSALFLLLSPVAGHAESFTPGSAVARALAQNPDLRAARLAIAEAEERLMRAGRLANPEIEAEIKPNLEGGEFSAGIGVSRRLPLANRLEFEKNVSKAQVVVARLEVQEAERALEFQVRTLAIKLLDLKSRHELKRRRQEQSRQLATAATQAAAKGEGSSLMATEFELESGQIEIESLELIAQEEGLIGELRPLLGLPPNQSLTMTGRLTEPQVPVAGGEPNVVNRPGYQAAQAKAEEARQNIGLQRASKWEDVAVGIGYERENAEDAGDGLQRDNFIGLKLSVPLPLGKYNLSHIREAEAAAQRRDAEAAALFARLRAEAASARAEMLAATNVYNRTSGPLLEKSRQLEDRYLASYQAGQSPLTDVLRSREKRLVLEASRLDALRDYNLARVRYEAAVGR